MHKGLSLTLAAILATLQLARAQDYPARNVTMVVPFPPGGGTDTGARIIAQSLSERWKKPVPAEFAALMAKDRERYVRIIVDKNITAE
jgi:tripartite-type tricarboxylate transporter receptor subunit TctC